jgi:predicted nucleic acid-binding protein
MVSYWDSSAIVPLLAREADSDQREDELRQDGPMVTWWGTSTELTSAMARRHRAGLLTGIDLDRAKARLQALQDQWIRVLPVEPLIHRAERLLWLHPLRAADAFQLAAALLACREDTRKCFFHCADQRLLYAATREGFPVKASNTLH